MSLDWGSPVWLALLVAMPPYYLLLRRGRAAVTYPGAGGLARAGVWSQWPSFLPDVLRVLALTALIFALARPRTPGAIIEERTDGVPIVIALDLSSSMLAEDFRPRNRLTVAKQNIARFIAAREDDPIALVAFAAEALTVVPLTTYDAVVLNALESLQVGLLEDGTAIGEGLAIAVNRLRAAAGESRVVILMSDGESNRGEIDPLDAAQAAAALGVRVHTIAVGSEGVARVPVGREGAVIRYAELPVGLDETLLREIATITGGQFFRATDPTALADVYSRIDAMEQAPVESSRRVEYAEWYQIILLVSGLALVAEWGLRGSRFGVIPG